MDKTSLCGMTADEILKLVVEKNSHALSIANSLYKKKIDDIFNFPGIPKQVKAKINSSFYTGLYKPYSFIKSTDGSVKYLFRNGEGQEFETVYLPDQKRKTVCISSQSGCRIGCRVCATGRYGFRGNLSVQDIINQILSLPDTETITHVVFMGMGEPMDNIDKVLRAIEIISAEWGLSISQRNITVSTVGLIKGVERFLDQTKANLALSLFSPFPEERFNMVPSEKKHPASQVIEIMKKYGIIRKRRMSIAYIMIQDINDTERHLEALKVLVRQTGIRINLLPYHPIPGDNYYSSTSERMQYFKHELVISGISASIRKSRGADISAACGLLASGLK